MRSFLNDDDGLTAAELTILCVLPVYIFVAIKLAVAPDISNAQVDFFGVLSYPIIAAIAKQAVERFGWPWLGRRGGGVPLDSSSSSRPEI